MDNMRAAIARTQLRLIEEKGEAFRKNYAYLVGKLTAPGRVEVPHENPDVERIPDSIQFRIPGFSREQMLAVMDRVQKAGLSLSARKILATTCDMRLLSFWDERHFDYIADVVNRAISEVS
jgi:hypothetical protein